MFDLQCKQEDVRHACGKVILVLYVTLLGLERENVTTKSDSYSVHRAVRVGGVFDLQCKQGDVRHACGKVILVLLHFLALFRRS